MPISPAGLVSLSLSLSLSLLLLQHRSRTKGHKSVGDAAAAAAQAKLLFFLLLLLLLLAATGILVADGGGGGGSLREEENDVSVGDETLIATGQQSSHDFHYTPSILDIAAAAAAVEQQKCGGRPAQLSRQFALFFLFLSDTKRLIDKR